MSYLAGVIVIGSLIWDNDDRKEWRDSRLLIDESFMVNLPIRYGRCSSSRDNTYTMVFSTICYSKKYGLGTGIVVPCKSKIKNFSDLKIETKKMGEAEGFNNNFSASWGGITTILLNPLKKINDSLIKNWKELMSRESVRYIEKYQKLKSEDYPVDKFGFLNIRWPKEVEPSNIIDEFDILIATITSPTLIDGRYPTAYQIANKMIEKNYYEYFFKNREYGITTFQDMKILKTFNENKPSNSFFEFNGVSLQKTKVDPGEIKKFHSEEDFIQLSVELFKEVSQVTCLLSCVYHLDKNNNPRKWKRNEAILSGLMVRISKLQSSIIDQTCQKRREIMSILLRCLDESIVNLNFLLKEGNEDLFNEYIESSLTEEKKLLEIINKNINKRRKELPIEQRMKQSIERTFEASSFSPEQIDVRRNKQWGKNLRERAKSIGLENAYYALFGLPSHAVHGNWQDLITHQLEYKNGEFSPNPNWNLPRPQLLLSMALLSAYTNNNYLDYILPECLEKYQISQMIDEVINKIRITDELHEQFLQAQL